MDKNKSHVLSTESLEKVRYLESQELCLRKPSALRRMAGAAKDATTEDIASCNVEADRIAKLISEKETQEAVEKEHAKNDDKLSEHGMDGLDGPLMRRCERGHCGQYQNGKVLNWNVAGLSDVSTDFFLSQLRCPHRGTSCCCRSASKHRMEWMSVHTSNSRQANWWRTAMARSHHTPAMERTSGLLSSWVSCWPNCLTKSENWETSRRYLWKFRISRTRDQVNT